MYSTASSVLPGVLDGLLAEDPIGLCDLDLGERAAMLLSASDRVAGLLAQTVREVESRGLAGGPFNPWGRSESWLAGIGTATHSRGELLRHVARARGTQSLPLVSDLHAGGEVSNAFVDAALAGARRLPEEARPGWDALLAGEARNIAPGDIATLLAHLLVMIDPDRADRKADSDTDGLWISPYGSVGGWSIKGTLHGLEGELVAAIINHYAQPLGPDDARCTSERRAAALVQICRMADRARTDADYLPAPRGLAHLVVLVTEDSWHAQAGSPAATTPHTVVDPGQLATLKCTAGTPDILIHATPHSSGTGSDEPAAPGTIGARGADARRPAGPWTSGIPLSEAAVEAAQLRSLLAGLVPTPAAARLEPLAYGRAERTAVRGQWLALIARDHHCVVGPCTRDPARCR